MSTARSALGGAARALAIATVGLVPTVAAPVLAHSPHPESSSPSGALTSPAPAPSVTAGPIGAVTLTDFDIAPEQIELTSTLLELEVANEGITPHNLTVRDEAGRILGGTPTMSQGENSPLLLTLPAPGVYPMFCALAGHESLGMVGRLVVSVEALASPQAGASIEPVGLRSTPRPVQPSLGM